MITQMDGSIIFFFQRKNGNKKKIEWMKIFISKDYFMAAWTQTNDLNVGATYPIEILSVNIFSLSLSSFFTF